MRGSETSLSQRGVQRHLWVSEGFGDIFGSVRCSETSLVSEGFGDIFGSPRGSETSLPLSQRGVQRHL